jgi:hypothetical protein
MARSKTAVAKLAKAGFKKIGEIPDEAVNALAKLSDEELKALRSAQKALAGKAGLAHGFLIF